MLCHTARLVLAQAHPWVRQDTPALNLSFNDAHIDLYNERRHDVLVEAEGLLQQVYQ